MRTAAYQPYVLWWPPLGVNNVGGGGYPRSDVQGHTHPHPLVYLPPPSGICPPRIPLPSGIPLAPGHSYPPGHVTEIKLTVLNCCVRCC